jgi:hypothetical protein
VVEVIEVARAAVVGEDTTLGPGGTQGLRLADGLPSGGPHHGGILTPMFPGVAPEEGEIQGEAEAVLPLYRHLVPHPGRRLLRDRVVPLGLSHGLDLGPRRQFPHEALHRR